MKTDTIALYSYDNIDSILDKLQQVSSAPGASFRFALLWPKRGRVIYEPLDFARIRNWAVTHSYQVAIVTENELPSAMASEQSLPVFATQTEAIEASWSFPESPSDSIISSQRKQNLVDLERQREQVQPAKAHSGARIVLFALALLSVITVLFLILPHAEIKISLPEEQKQIEIRLWTNENLRTVMANGGIPSKQDLITLSMSAIVPATGTVQSEPALATGMITINNTCDRGQIIDKGTRVYAGETEFSILNELNLAAHAEIETNIEAVVPGADSNLPEDSISQIEYPFDICMVVKHSSPTTGGDDGLRTGPSAQDYQTALTEISEHTEEKAIEALHNRYGELRMILGDSIQVEQITDEQIIPEFGYFGETLTVRQNLTVSVKTVSCHDINTIVRSYIEAQSGQPVNIDTDYSYKVISPPQDDNGTTYWTVSADWSENSNVDEQEIQELTSGKSLRAARQLIMDVYATDGEPQIEIWPGWLKHMPVAPSNIFITINH